ncbi:MAG: SDR family oxidoreductase [Verrucomicrobia bacterium]|nr:SDR family oxidoreductase [Verrucomicrobiota bacterium]MBV8482774.1 SDR family oxidoreductase [Verrucomicrobiota bacterium]
MESVLITGANRGIGYALAKALVATDFRVFAGCRKTENAVSLKKLGAAHGDLLQVLPLDVSSDESVAAAAHTLEGRVDIIVNNAGVMPERGDEKITSIDFDHFRDTFEINVLGCARVIRSFLPHLRRSNRPRILNLSSGLGSISERDNFSYYAYAVSKAALNMLTRSLAFELAPEGITIVAISPGWVRTDMGGDDASISAEESASALVEAIQGIGPNLNGQFLDRFGHAGKYVW